MRILTKVANTVDGGFSEALVRFRGEQEGLVTLCCHGVFYDQEEALSGAVDPFQVLTLANFEQILETFAKARYDFVTGEDLKRSSTLKRALWLTFDDGYANNLRLLPLLERWNAKATIFVSTANIENGNSYWWDVLHRNSSNAAARDDEREQLKKLPTLRIVQILEKRYGLDAFVPIGEADRPLTISELQELARHPLIEIGNHTHNHAILPRETPSDMATEIRACQERILSWTGRKPISIAYPNGEINADGIEASRKEGLLFGVTTRPGRSPLPIPGEERLNLPRIPSFSHKRLRAELAKARSGMSLLELARKIRPNI